jgi:hypothetical protein
MVYDSPPVIFSDGSYVVIDDASLLDALAFNYHMGWDLDSSSEMETARGFLETISSRQKKILHTYVSALLRANSDDYELTQEWFKMGARGWLSKTKIRSFLNELLLELERTAD